MATISNLEIFGAGTHSAMTGKMTITEDDLDEMVEAFNALSSTNIVKPHLKLGHTDAQKWFGQKDGIPALGWIEKVWRVGSKLLANVKDVPGALIDMIRQGRYHNVSAEVYWDADIEHNGKKFSRVLSAVSLLGVEMPAVKDLAGLAASLFHTGPVAQFSETKTPLYFAAKEKDTPMFTQEQVDSLIAAAVAEATGEAEEKFSAEVDDLKVKLEVSDKAKTSAIAELETVKASAAQAEAAVLVDTAIKDGKLLPKQRDFALAVLSSKDTKIKFGSEEKSVTVMFKEFLDSQGKVLDLKEKSNDRDTKLEFKNAAEELDHAAKTLIKADPKLKYADAFSQAKVANPELTQRYAEMSN